MKQRIITAVLGIAICLAALFFGGSYPLVIAVAASIIATAMVSEFLSAKSLLTDFKISIPCLAFSLIMPITVNFPLRFLPIYLYTLIIFVVMIIFHNKITFDQIAFAFCGTTVITLTISCISLMAFGSFSIYYIVLSLGVPWMADSGAYFVGTFLGKHKLCPEISPKKTVEGAVGGLIIGVLGGVIASIVFQFVIYENVCVDYLRLIILCLIISVISIIGDLSFSLVKRSCNIKDFGSIMPGHGGFCDRFDSVVFAAPIIMFAASTLPLIGEVINCI